MAQNTQMEPYMAIATLSIATLSIATQSIATLSIERAAPTMTDTQAAASICDYPGACPLPSGPHVVRWANLHPGTERR